MKQVTLRDIASRIGVSINTVSLALKDSDRVAPDTRRKIRLCAQELGYIPNAAAQTLVTRRSGLIGVALGTRSDFRDDMFLGMVEQARHFGYDVMVSSETDDPVQIVRAFQKRLTEGVVVLLSEEKAVLLAEHVRSTRIPHVFILGERPRTNIRGPWVAVDNYMGAYQAVSHLVQSGHHAIGYLAGSSAIHSGKTQGVYQAFADHGLTWRHEWVFASEHSVLGGREAGRAFLDLPQHDRPTAVFARTDHLAMGFIAAVTEQGVRVPHDVSVIGYDGIEAGQLMNPSLTTMVYPARQIGARAMDALHDIIEGNPGPTALLIAPSVHRGETVLTKR